MRMRPTDDELTEICSFLKSLGDWFSGHELANEYDQTDEAAAKCYRLSDLCHHKRKQGAWCVRWTEHESGWGQKPFSMEAFSTKESAEKRIQNELAGRDIHDVPDWYISPSEPLFLPASADLMEALQTKSVVVLDYYADPSKFQKV